MYVPAMAWQQFSNDSLTLPKRYISCNEVAALVITGNYVAMWMHHFNSVAIKLLAWVIAGNYVAMWMHHCHSVAMELLTLVIAGNVEASFPFCCYEVAGIGHCWQLCGNDLIASEAVEAAQIYPVMLRMMGVGFSKGGQKWPQICSTRLSF